MAAALLARRLEQMGVVASVVSAGLLPGGAPATPAAVAAMAAMDLDTSGHRSRHLSQADLAGADLVLGMTREHVREAVLASASCWPRTFTLKELVGRAEQAGPRRADQDLGDWLGWLHAGRSREDLLGASPADDVEDPIGGTGAAYAATARELDHLTARLAELAWGHPRTGSGIGPRSAHQGAST